MKTRLILTPKTKTKLILARKQTTNWLPCEDQVDFHFTITARKWRQGWLAHKTQLRLIWLSCETKTDSHVKTETKPIIARNRDQANYHFTFTARKWRQGWFSCENWDQDESCVKSETRLIITLWLPHGNQNQDNYRTRTSYDYRAKLRPGWLSL